MVPLVPFGERVIHLPLETAKHSKGVAATQPGIWFDINGRTEENLIGTNHGVVKSRAVSRLANGDQWGRDTVLEMGGLPWAPAPGKASQHIPVSIGEHERRDKCGDDDPQPQDAIDDEEGVERPYKECECNAHSLELVTVLALAVPRAGPEPARPKRHQRANPGSSSIGAPRPTRMTTAQNAN